MPSLGWKVRTWKAKVPCQACRRGIRAGMTHPNDLGNPPGRALCFADFNLLVEDPDEFARLHER